MAGTVDIDGFRRIEDFIALAKTGVAVNAEVHLREQEVIQKVHPQETEDMDKEQEMYMLMGDFAFTVGEKKKVVSKSYVYGSKESLNESKINRYIANERLKMDYMRLHDATIDIEETFF